MIPGVAAADGLGFVDLPPGSLAADTSRIPRPVRVFAFDRSYQARYPSIRTVAGSFRPASALLSVEAARALAAEPGVTLALRIPGRRMPLSLPVSGVVDLARAQPLFSSRKSAKFEEFLYVPDSVVVTPETFRDTIIPAFDRTRASGCRQRHQELSGARVGRVGRSVTAAVSPGKGSRSNDANPQAIASIGPEQDYLIDNISNTLAVARGDAAVGKRMFSCSSASQAS